MTAEPEGDTPNRTVRIPTIEWNAGLRAAAENGEKLPAVIRRGIASYVAQTDDDYRTEYRATSVADSQLVVMGISGELASVRRQFPAKHWHLESCRRSTYQPVK
ncbi:hypothetical protein [Mycobacterium sp. 48b]|uniref:hypothetical protein n=1 Tax=Mycobacterium sp. 48b TaxID=3400426 RepID=UPI003AAE621C